MDFSDNLIKDSDGSLDGEHATYTNYIVKVLGDEPNIAAKSGLPQLEKKVKDINNFANIKDYIKNYCAYECKYFIIKRLHLTK